MTLGDVLDDLRGRGVTLALDGEGGLRVNAPRGAVTAELRERLRSHKPELMRWLQEDRGDDGAALPLCTPEPSALYEPFPLSDLQLGFYMADDPFMEFHVRPHYYLEKDEDGLDVAGLERAWNRALQRHRNELVVVLAEGQLQTLRAPATLQVVLQDLSHLPPAAVQASLANTRQQMMRAELPIDRWPWLDLRVSRWLEDGKPRARVHYNHNNFFSDGYGTTRLLREVESYRREPGLTLPPIELSFRDAALALERLAQQAPGQRARRYWEDRLPGLPDSVALPLVPGLDKRCRSHLQRREGFLPAPEWARFKQHAQDAGLTPSSAVFAAYAEVLSCWGGSEHFVVSNMMTRRLNLHPQMQSILGNFASLYPLEVDLRGRTSFQDGAQRLQEQVIRDARHLQWGGMRVMQALNHRSGSLGSAPVPYVVGSGLFMEGFERSDFSCLETSQVLLDHQFWELADGRLYFVWDLIEAFFPAGLVDDMWRAYGGLLQLLAGRAAAWSGPGLELLPGVGTPPSAPTPADERTPVPAGTLAELLPAAAHAWGSATAVRCEGTGWAYAQLAATARRVAAELTGLGVGRGERVAVMAERGAAWLAAVHGVVQAGAAYVPIDPELPAQRCAAMLADCQARVLLCSSRHAGREWPPGVLAINVQAGLAEPAAQSLCCTEPAAADLAYLIYTSGSTGNPKGVMIDHRGALNTVVDINRRFGVTPADRVFGVSSIGFDLSVYDVFGAAEAAACVVYPAPGQALNPAHWLELMRAEAVTVWNSAPPLAALLADMAGNSGTVLPALRLILLSGDWIPLDLPARLRQVAPQARIVSLGGATEASIWSIAHELESQDPAWPSVPYGRALQHQSWRVLDPQGRDVPTWVTGELYIGGVGLALGYWNDADKTAQAFLTDPHTGQRLYRTGDLGRLHPSGLIEFLGRRDTQVKVQGHRIELGDIEAALRSHPAVVAAVAVAQRSGPAGAAQAQVQLAAHVVLQAPGAVQAEALKAHVAQRLPAYMVPALLAFVAELPLSANGKLDRKQLPALTHEARASAQALRPPQGEAETRLLALWSQVLGRELSLVGEDFFDIGGQSFEGVRLVGLVQQAFGTRLSLGDIWRHRTVAEQALLITGDAAPTRGPLSTLKAGGDAVPLFLVHPAGGSVLCYRHLAAALHRPVHAFEASLPATVDEHPPSVAALARLYTHHLALQQPQGPVLLGGWSSGGPIAFEMAVQLRATGREVAGVVIMDSPAPRPMGLISDTQLLGWFVEDMGLDARALPAALAWAGRTPLAGTTPAGRMQMLATELASQGLVLPLGAAELGDVYLTFDAVVRATAGYVASTLDCPMLMLRAQEGCVSEFAQHPHAAEPDWGWARHTTAALKAHGMAASHHTLLLPGAAARCAERIETWIAASTLDPAPTHHDGERHEAHR